MSTKVKITVKETQMVVVDIGELSVNLFRDILAARGDGTFDGNWSVLDLRGVNSTVDSIEVEEVPAKK